MKINKCLVLIFVTLAFFIPTTTISAKVYDNTSKSGNKISISIDSTSVEGRENQTTVSGSKPLITSNDISTKIINEKVEDVYKAETKTAATNRSRAIVFSYEVYESDGYISISILSTVQNATESQNINVINFSSTTGKIVYLSDVLGGKTIDVVNNYVNKIIKDDAKYTNEVTITNNSQFYISSGKPVVVFNSYTLAQNQSKAEAITVDLSKITSFILSANNYYIKDKFNNRMIPLRQTCEGLYYTVSWNNFSKSFTVTDSATTSVGYSDSNEYTYNNKKIQLEYKPDLTSGTLYVPISYFTDVLGLSYKIDPTGEITFYKIN